MIIGENLLAVLASVSGQTPEQKLEELAEKEESRVRDGMPDPIGDYNEK